MPLFALVAMLMVGYGALFSLLAEIRNNFGFSSFDIGLIGGAAFAAGFVAQLWLSRYADIGYGNLMLQAGLAISVLSTAWMIFASTLPEWIISRALLGFGAGCIRPAVRRLAVTMKPEEAGQFLGLLAAYETGGFLIGPVIAATFNTWLGFSETFIALTLLLAVFIPVVMRADVPASKEPQQDNVLRSLLAKPVMQACMAMGIAFWITIGVFEAIWAIFLSDLGASMVFIGLTMSLFGIPMIFIAPIAGGYAQRKGALRVATVSIFVSIVCMLFYGFIDNLWLLCLPLLVHSIADSYTMPATQLAVAEASGDAALAAGQGLFGATGMAVGAVTAVAGGALYETLGASGLWVSAALAMVVCMVFARLRLAGLSSPLPIKP